MKDPVGKIVAELQLDKAHTIMIIAHLRVVLGELPREELCEREIEQAATWLRELYALDCFNAD